MPGAAGAEMYYTSGTSGRPKGVILSRATVILHALGCMVEHRITRKDVWLHCAPMFLIYYGAPTSRLLPGGWVDR